MSLFSNFPTINYYFSDTDPSEYKLRHIIRRFKVEDLVKDNIMTYQTYLISEGDSPDIVSYKFYGRPDWHWIILMYNDIINPLVDWPRSTQQVLDSARAKYFITKTATFTTNSVNITVADSTGIEVGASITGVGVPNDLYVVAVNGNTIVTNISSSFSGAKTVKIDTVLATHHAVNSKGIIVDLTVYQGSDLQYIRNIDYEHELNDRRRLIKMPMKAHAEKIDLEAQSVLRGT